MENIDLIIDREMQKSFKSDDKHNNSYIKNENTTPSFNTKSWNTKIEKTIKLIEKQCRLYKKMH